MNSYLIESEDSLSLQKEREKIIQENHFEEASTNTYDLEESTLDQALEDLDTYSLLSNQKVIIIQNIENIKYDDEKKAIDHLLKYLDSPNPDNLLIIEAKKLNNVSKITKELKKKCKYQTVELDPKKYIKASLEGYEIDNSTAFFLAEYCGNDISKISCECEKLKNYKLKEKKITKKDIEEIIIPKLGEEKEVTFSFTRALAMRDKKMALQKYRELLSYNIEPLGIIGLLASQFRIVYQVKLLVKEKLTNKEITEKLNENSDYRIAKTRELIPYYTEEELLKYMQSLAEMDYRMKTEDVDGNHLIEMFILSV